MFSLPQVSCGDYGVDCDAMVAVRIPTLTAQSAIAKGHAHEVVIATVAKAYRRWQAGDVCGFAQPEYAKLLKLGVLSERKDDKRKDDERKGKAEPEPGPVAAVPDEPKVIESVKVSDNPKRRVRKKRSG